MRALTLLVLLAGCSKTPAPVRPVGEEFVEVGYPPPPAEVEEREAELAFRPDCSFVDGHYEWRGKRWQWQRGEWLVPPAGCSYAQSRLMWSRPPNARLYYTPPRWYPASGKGSCEAPISCETPKRPAR